MIYFDQEMSVDRVLRSKTDVYMRKVIFCLSYFSQKLLSGLRNNDVSFRDYMASVIDE